MAKGKRGHEEVETYDSDGGFVSNDDGNAPKSKKTKKAGTKAKDENKFWEVSSGRNPRRVELSNFKNTTLVNIREFYEKDNEYLPGKKGISLTVEQYKAFLKAIPEINTSLRSQGIEVAGSADIDEDESEEEAKPQKKAKAKKEEKSNIEATSDEDE